MCPMFRLWDVEAAGNACVGGKSWPVGLSPPQTWPEYISMVTAHLT